MKLYEVHAEIERLANAAVWDPERGAFIDLDTGEIMTEDELREQFEHLGMERLEIMKYLAKLVLNIRADIKALKEEEARLKDRRARFEKKEERLLSILDRECDGKKTDLEVATFNYRKTSKVDIVDVETALEWLQENHEEAIKYKDPEISKTEVAKLIKAGENVPGIRIADGISGSLK